MKYNFLLLIFFSFISCSSSKSIETSRSEDIKQKETLSIRAATVPESHACLAIPSTELRELPEKAVYMQKDGQATASIRFLHDTLFVTASCDSLQMLVYEYAEEIERLNNSTQTVSKERSVYSYKWGFMGLLAVLLFVLWRYFKHTIRSKCAPNKIC
ncbi:hypothetical protein [Parabacteroides sp. AM08-6]|uniref:hypothetical protein n=1 Tax=Parabacteroides sp. AM08-6 TaxID=2292053 RepID=UPI0011C3608D|nr:hypothetical protein [Parabacteroides sp. AM08-6]